MKGRQGEERARKRDLKPKLGGEFAPDFDFRFVGWKLMDS